MKRIARMLLFTACLMICGPMPAVCEEEITIAGTGSGMELLKALSEAYMTQNPGTKINVPDSIGSSGAVKTVGRDQHAIGRIARPLNENEKELGLTYVPFARMPIVFFTNKSVEINELSPEQVVGIFSGEITNWQEVGGKDAKIRVIIREPGDSSLQVLKESFPGFGDILLTPKSKTTFSDPETCQFAEQKEDTIAFGTYINAKNHQLNIPTTGGKTPNDADYPYLGTLAFIYKEENYRGLIKDFVEFTLSENATVTIRFAGGLPVWPKAAE